jgi:hypothetical protein
MNKKKDLKLEITELFMAKADWKRCFFGTIKRGIDDNGNPIVRAKIKVNDGYIYAMAEDQCILGEMMDKLILMILDKGLHSNTGLTSMIAETPYFLN